MHPARVVLPELTEGPYFVDEMLNRSELFFDDAFTDQVYLQEPYAQNDALRLKNDGDNIYQSGGDQLVLNVTPVGAGYTAIFDIGMQI